MEDPEDVTEAEHAVVLFEYMKHVYECNRLCDVVVHCDGELIARAHRVVLAAFSGHLDMALEGVVSEGDLQINLDSSILGISAEHMKAIIRFMYTSRIDPMLLGIRRSAQCLGCVSLIALLNSDEAKTGALVEDACHAQRLLQSVRKFYMDNKYCDVHLLCQSMPLTSCHRVVLSAYSSHFESALAATDLDGCVQVILDIDSTITGVTMLDLRTIINYMYSSILRRSAARSRGLIAAARSLDIARLLQVLFDSPGGVQPQHGDSTNSKQPSDAAAAEVYMNSADGEQQQHRLLKPEAADKVPDVAAHEDVETPGSSRLALEQDADDLLGPTTSSLSAVVSDSEKKSAEAEYEDIYDEFIDSELANKGSSYSRRLQAQRQQQAQARSNPVPLRQGRRIRNLPKRIRLDQYGFGLPEINGSAAPFNSVVLSSVGEQRELQEKPFKCPYCDYRAREKSAVEKHIRCIHTLEAPYKCPFCNQAFKVQSNLVRHVRAHKGEKPYACKKCGQAYADKKNMDSHVYREHLKVKQLECPGCGARFWRHDRFAEHCRKKHAITVEPESEERRQAFLAENA